MTGSKGYGLRGTVGCAALLTLSACGGTVDFRGDDDAKGGDGSGALAGVGATGGRHGGSGGAAGGGGNYQGGAGAVGGHAGAPQPIEGHVFPGPIEDAVEPEDIDDGVTLGEEPAFGKVLAYEANPDGLGTSLYLLTLETGCSQQLTRPAAQAKQPVFSPDGARLAYASLTSGRYQIHVMDLSTGDVQRVTELESGATSPSFSADGSQLAFLSGDSDAAPGPGGGGVFDVMVLNLEARTQRVVLRAEDGPCCVSSTRAPTFVGNDELFVSLHTSLIAIDLLDFTTRDVMPTSGRIPNLQDPAPAPDGIRYAYTDYCGGGLSLYIGRLDGTTGDTCQNATSIAGGSELVGADWGAFGYIAAHRDSDARGLVLIDDQELSVSELPAVRGARNAAWAPQDLVLPIHCE
jgi:hypothetical protein